MKKGWKTKTLEEACQFSNGLWKGEKPPFVKVGVIRNTNFTKEGTLDDSDIAYLDVEAKKLDKRRLQFGDIILEKSGGGPNNQSGALHCLIKRKATSRSATSRRLYVSSIETTWISVSFTNFCIGLTSPV